MVLKVKRTGVDGDAVVYKSVELAANNNGITVALLNKFLVGKKKGKSLGVFRWEFATSEEFAILPNYDNVIDGKSDLNGAFFFLLLLLLLLLLS